ncbi:MAG: UvrD-helicase domain-containing protein [Thermoguttaceae bacterium]|nr:UvrD-helicase domain-containing protein [Thermoguttaceae bacterium]
MNSYVHSRLGPARRAEAGRPLGVRRESGYDSAPGKPRGNLRAESRRGVFYADLHIHSKFSRATSRECDLEHLAVWAARKGIAVVGTGDFTHPGWFAEIEERLVPAEPGLFRLRPELVRTMRESLGGPSDAACGEVRFMLQVEISTIYKKDGRTRKVHHLVYVPGLDQARRLTQALARIGNLASDGRPILGLDSRDLLEITLEAGEGCYLVPAHIWTPWFAVLGSNSGFDSIEHCYGDLSGEVFALETGLSSDPEMNWRLSRLDRYALVSNSDAHSPSKLGREACVFDTELSYFAVRHALRTGEGYQGTVEFFPEEGKYHLDGHRKCGVRLTPEESRQHGDNCPACGKPVTRGVMHRVVELADRPAPPDPRPPRAAPFRSLIPLDEVLAEVLGVGPQTHTVRRAFDALLARLGPELSILESVPVDDIRRAGSPLLAEAIARMRGGRVIRQAGYDGQYGVIRLFTDEELRRGSAVSLLFAMPEDDETEPTRRVEPAEAHEAPRQPAPDKSRPACPAASAAEEPASAFFRLAASAILDQLDPDQRAAAEAVDGPVLIVAGPGTGKTRTLTHRLAHLVAERGAAPEACLALTFSRRAAAEMAERLQRLLPGRASQVPVMTFHALGLRLLREFGGRLGMPESFQVASDADRAAMLAESLATSEHTARSWLVRIARHKRGAAGRALADRGEEVFALYERQMRARGWIDFDDLVLVPLRLLQEHPDVREQLQRRFRWISVDEFQDLDAAQYALLRLLVPADGNIAAIGDPDQAIYGFRGADVGCFQRFSEDFPGARAFHLTRNYRSTQTIIDAALQLIAPASLVAGRRLEAGGLGQEHVEIHACATERAEAEFVVHAIERLVGGSTFFSLDSDRATGHEAEGLSFADIAVLYRTDAQADPLVEAFERSGMPYQCRSHEPLTEHPAVRSLIGRMREIGQGPGADTPVLERLERAAAEAGANGPLAESLLAALRAAASGCGADLARFFSELALGTEIDLWDARADRVSLLTLHAAKGLEFPVVFLVGCEDGLLPLHWGNPDEAALAEERRLFFVGMTRARRRLVLTHAKRRLRHGSVRPTNPSPFLCDIEQRLVAWHEERLARRPSPRTRQRTLFEIE